MTPRLHALNRSKTKLPHETCFGNIAAARMVGKECYVWLGSLEASVAQGSIPVAAGDPTIPILGASARDNIPSVWWTAESAL